MDVYQQYHRPWKQISYVTNRAYHEMYYDQAMCDIDHPEDASRAAYLKTLEPEPTKRPWWKFWGAE